MAELNVHGASVPVLWLDCTCTMTHRLLAWVKHELSNADQTLYLLVISIVIKFDRALPYTLGLKNLCESSLVLNERKRNVEVTLEMESRGS